MPDNSSRNRVTKDKKTIYRNHPTEASDCPGPSRNAGPSSGKGTDSEYAEAVPLPNGGPDGLGRFDGLVGLTQNNGKTR